MENQVLFSLAFPLQIVAARWEKTGKPPQLTMRLSKRPVEMTKQFFMKI